MCQSPSLFQKVTFSKKKQKSGKNKYIILKCMLVNDIITEYILAALLNDFSEINVWFLIPYLTITLTPLHGEILPLRNYSRSKQNYRCRILEIILISTNMVGSSVVRWFLGFHRFQQATTTWYAEASTQKKGKAGTCRIGWYRLTTFNLQKGAFWQDWLKTNKSKKKIVLVFWNMKLFFLARFFVWQDACKTVTSPMNLIQSQLLFFFRNSTIHSK